MNQLFSIMKCHCVFEGCPSEDQVGYVRSAQLATCQVSDDKHAWLMAIALIADGKVPGHRHVLVRCL